MNIITDEVRKAFETITKGLPLILLLVSGLVELTESVGETRGNVGGVKGAARQLQLSRAPKTGYPGPFFH